MTQIDFGLDSARDQQTVTKPRQDSNTLPLRTHTHRQTYKLPYIHTYIHTYIPIYLSIPGYTFSSRLCHLGLDSAQWIIHVVDTNASGYQRAGFRPTIDTIRGPMQTLTTGTNSTRHFHCVWYGFGRGPAVSRWITEAKTEAVQSPAHPQKNQTHLGMLVASLVPVFSTLIFQTNRP